jgi:hypothetical protein
VGFGTEILFILMLGLLVLGPKQLYALLAFSMPSERERTKHLDSGMHSGVDTSDGAKQ